MLNLEGRRILFIEVKNVQCSYSIVQWIKKNIFKQIQKNILFRDFKWIYYIFVIFKINKKGILCYEFKCA